ncbi:MAG: methionine adenosyltransferase [Phycisphaerae bacterium]|jgi:S-adenosylmethionine synthetase|nr:methionine adenosyltransferase [Phycisphaerae bacterium]
MAVSSKRNNADEPNLFTSESVTMGHPDKVADQVSDAILDALLAQDKNSRVACETMCKNSLIVVAGEVTTKAVINIPEIVKKTIAEIGYTSADIGLEANTCTVVACLERQSPDISQGVTATKEKEQGAGDQGLMFGFACNETPVLMPLPIYLSHRICEQLSKVRQNGTLPFVRPDGKAQVTVEYKDRKPVRIDTVVCSTQYSDDPKYVKAGLVDKTGAMTEKGRKALIEKVIKPVLPKNMIKGDIKFHINPTGRFVIGGPHGDCGLTGRKIIVDTYGGRGRHGGGAFSGKDPSKVDRSACYMARYIAKNIVAAGLAEECEVQLAYAIGVADPVSVCIDTYGTGKVDEPTLVKLVRKHFPLKPRGIIEHLKLLRPIYTETAKNGHFGHEKPTFTWEKTDKAKILRREAGIK